MLDNPKLKLWRISANVLAYVIAETRDDVDDCLSEYVDAAIHDDCFDGLRIVRIKPTKEQKEAIPEEWLNSLPYCDHPCVVDVPTVAEFMDEAIAAEADRVKRGPLPGQLSLGLEGESCEPS